MKRISGDAGRRLSGGATALAAMAAALSGCADLRAATDITPLGVDPASPVAAAVNRAQASSGPIPSFAAIPPKPTDIRPAAAYKAEVVTLVTDRRALARAEAAHPPAPTDTEAFAAAQRARLAGEEPVSPQRQAEAEAFARKLREAAKSGSGPQ